MSPDDAQSDPDKAPRSRTDRRRRDLPFWSRRRLRGRRMRQRRADGHDALYLVDRVPGRVLVLAVAILIMTVVDGVFTVLLLERGCVEANPVMQYLLERGNWAFFTGKYVLTAAFLPVALVMNHYRLFGTRLRVGHFVPVVVVLYTLLIVYQVALWHESEPILGACR